MADAFARKYNEFNEPQTYLPLGDFARKYNVFSEPQVYLPLGAFARKYNEFGAGGAFVTIADGGNRTRPFNLLDLRRNNR